MDLLKPVGFVVESVAPFILRVERLLIACSESVVVLCVSVFKAISFGSKQLAYSIFYIVH